LKSQRAPTLKNWVPNWWLWKEYGFRQTCLYISNLYSYRIQKFFFCRVRSWFCFILLVFYPTIDKFVIYCLLVEIIFLALAPTRLYQKRERFCLYTFIHSSIQDICILIHIYSALMLVKQVRSLHPRTLHAAEEDRY
jgi:hypothetical protein